MTWVDGERAQSLPLPDRGLSFGDGLFETYLLLDGCPVLAPRHRRRLNAGLRALQLPDPGEAWERAITRAAAQVPQGPAALRMTLTRGGGPRGYAPPDDPAPRLIAQLSPLPPGVLDWQPPARLGLSSIAWPLQPALAGVKHLNRLEQVLATAEYRRQGEDEAVMLDTEGAVVSVVAGNLFALREGCLHTPPLARAGIAGTRRAELLEQWAPALGLAVKEAALTLDDLLGAGELFYCNALVGIRAVASLGPREWRDTPVSRRLHAHYRASLGRGES